MTLVREMTEADLDAASLLAEELVLLHHSWDRTRFFTTPDVAKGYRWWFARQLGEAGVVLLVAEVEGQIAGYLYGSLEERDWAKLLDAHGAIHDVYVADSHRRSGVARALMQAAIAALEGQGVGRVVLSSATPNTQAQALFSSMGFRPTMIEMTRERSSLSSDA